MSKAWTLAFCAIALNIGNCSGDQATIKDCAIYGHAAMVGGGSIECTVTRETK